MREPETSSPRQTLVNASVLAHALDDLRPRVGSTAAMWRRPTDRSVVDLDAVAALLPDEESETIRPATDAGPGWHAACYEWNRN